MMNIKTESMYKINLKCQGGRLGCRDPLVYLKGEGSISALGGDWFD
jgi:hypothetical protein